METALKHCPFCEQPNLCGAGQPGACWFASADVSFPAEMLELLAKEKRGQRCVCRGCVEAYHANPEGFRRAFAQL